MSKRIKKGEWNRPVPVCPEPSRDLVLSLAPEDDAKVLDKKTAQVLEPETKAAVIATGGLLNPIFGQQDTMACVRALKESIAQVQANDMRQADAMLVTHAQTLDSVFAECLRMWMANKSSNHAVGQDYLRMAMKAQAQARTAWESLSKIKNPVGATFIRQANVANGPQQVNNGSPGSTTPASAPAYEKIESQPNEILGVAHHGMDSRAETEAVGGDTQVGAMAQSDRAANAGGKGTL